MAGITHAPRGPCGSITHRRSALCAWRDGCASQAIAHWGDPCSHGDKILPINPFSGAPVATLRWRYRMGAGLGSLKLEREPARAPEALERATRRSVAAGAFRLSRTAGASAS